MVDFKKLKTTSGDIDRLTKAIENMSRPQNTFPDENEGFWKPTLDKAGNAYAVIRFLPEPAVDGDEGLPYVRVFSHGFKNEATGKWYIENSLTTLGQKDPVGEYNSNAWNSGPEGQEIARKQKRKTTYIVNIKVIEDSGNPDAVGREFQYKIGPRLFRKIEEAIDPWHDEDGNEIPGTEKLESVNPFDFWKGATFRLRVKTIKSGNNKYPNYDDSTFVKDSEGQIVTSALSDDDDELERLWKALPSLKAHIAPDKFKSYDELKKKFYDVIGEGVGDTAPATKPTVSPTKSAFKSKTLEDAKPSEEKTDDAPWYDSDDDDLAMFQKLAQ